MSRRTLILLLVLGCSGPDATASPGVSCDERIDRMAERLREHAERSQESILAFEGLELPSVADEAGLARVERTATTIRITPTEVLVDGGRMADPEALRERLDTFRRNYPVLHPSQDRPPPFVHVGLAGSLPASRLQEVLAWLPEDTTARLAVAHGPGVDALPPDASVGLRREVRRLPTDFMARVEAYDTIYDLRDARCAPLIRVFGDLANVDPDEKAQQLAERAPEAVRECGCARIDLVRLETRLSLTLLDGVPTDAGRRTVALPRSLDAREGETVQQLVDRL